MKATFSSTLLAASLLAQPILSCTPFNPNAPLVEDPKLPDPFKLQSGQEVSTVAQWDCRRTEISDLFQEYELGTLPGRPSRLGTRFYHETNTLALTAEEHSMNTSIAFNVSIKYPVNVTGDGPWPAVIVYGGASLPIPAGAATIIFNNDDIAQQNGQQSRGVGKFYNLYGANATASAMMAWAWAVSRIIDALEDTPRAMIDPTRLAVTGCSRNGKGAFVAGAFDTRIALTIPQESGSGGSACWRLSDYMLKNGTNTQTASEIVQENVWFSQEFAFFGNDTSLLPVDHHMLAALVAPRGLYVLDNTAYDWLGPWSSWGCMNAGHLVYQALNASSNFGFDQTGNHLHCLFPTAQSGANLNAFYQKFLFGNSSANTNVFVHDTIPPFNINDWVDWNTPELV